MVDALVKVSDTVLKNYESVSNATVLGELAKRGYMKVFMNGVGHRTHYYYIDKTTAQVCLILRIHALSLKLFHQGCLTVVSNSQLSQNP